MVTRQLIWPISWSIYPVSEHTFRHAHAVSRRYAHRVNYPTIDHVSSLLGFITLACASPTPSQDVLLPISAFPLGGIFFPFAQPWEERPLSSVMAWFAKNLWLAKHTKSPNRTDPLCLFPVWQTNG